MERRALARLVTPDAATMLADDRAWIDELTQAPDADAVRFASRIVGKDFLKVLRGLTLMRGGPDDVAIPQMHARVAQVSPERSELADLLFALYDNPITDPRMVRVALDQVEAAEVVSVITRWFRNAPSRPRQSSG